MRTTTRVIPILSTAFGAASGVAIDEVAPSAAFGLIWGLVAAAIAPRVARRGARRALSVRSRRLLRSHPAHRS
jgi:hypothetical protein